MSVLAGLALVAASTAWAVDSGPDASVPASPTTIYRAEFCSSGGISDELPGASCAWKNVRLAKLWHTPRGVAIADAWYKLHFDLQARPEGSLGLYTVAFNKGGRVFVNGQLIGDAGLMSEPLPLNWNRPQFFVVPAAVLRAGDNEIEIQQRAEEWEQGWLAPVQVGGEAELRAVWQRRVFWQNDTVRLLGVCTGTIGIFMIGVWLSRRRDTVYFWFACVSLLWTVQSLDYYVTVPPVPAHLWEHVVECAPVLRAVLLFMFVLRYCEMNRPWLERLWWYYLGCGSIAIFGNLMPGYLIDSWYLVVLVASAYFIYLQARVSMRRRQTEGAMLAIAGIVLMGLSAYDLWLFSLQTWTDRIYLAHFSAPLYVVIMTVILVRRFVESLNAHERLTAVLEQRVAEKAAEIERNYDQLMEVRRDQALAIERGRIMSEMHDGIGSQLTMALSLVRRIDREANPDGSSEDSQAATVLRESIEDLQLIIDSLEPVENDLLTVLGTLRYRLQDRLGKAGIELQWNVVDLPPLPVLTPQAVLSILRILQQAFANCLQHSGATRITVATGLVNESRTDELVHITIRDNGKGIVGSAAHHGLERMNRRAASLGGRVDITSTPGTTEVKLSFPTRRAELAPQLAN